MKRTIAAILLTLGLLAVLSASVALADDFKTADGKEYKNATVTRVEPDGIVVKTKSGISKLYFVELPKDVQQRFNYTPQQATAYSAQQAANYATYQNQQQKQEEENRHQQEDAIANNRAILGQQQASNNRIQGLQERYAALEQQEAALQQRISDAGRPGTYQVIGRSHYHHPNPEASQLWGLKKQLENVLGEKKDVARQLNKAQ